VSGGNAQQSEILCTHQNIPTCSITRHDKAKYPGISEYDQNTKQNKTELKRSPQVEMTGIKSEIKLYQ